MPSGWFELKHTSTPIQPKKNSKKALGKPHNELGVGQPKTMSGILISCQLRQPIFPLAVVVCQLLLQA
jgi:hypothetical protein